MAGTERRRHVRLKPSVDVPVRVALLHTSDGLMREALDVVDISVGGMALTSPALRGTEPGTRLKLQLSLGAGEEHTVDVITRWTKADTVGVELLEAPTAASQALSRYVAELLERGASA